MSLARSFVHAVTSRLPQGFHRMLDHWYNRHAVQYFFNSMGVGEALKQCLFHKYTSRRAYDVRLAKLAEIRRKPVITVVFQVWNLSKWKSESVYRAMEQHPRFRPVIWLTDEPGTGETERVAMRRKLLEHFVSSGSYHVTQADSWEALNKEVAPNLTFIADPYIQDINMPPRTSERLLCYVRYCFPNTVHPTETDLFLHNMVLFFFVEHDSVLRESSRMMHNKGRNLVCTGHPMTEELIAAFRRSSAPVWKQLPGHHRKVIWAPHWTIGDISFYVGSTFLQVCDTMVKIAEKYADRVQFAFKPHPTLYRTLCDHPDWGREKTDAYYARWADMPNGQLETGAYADLFAQSDAMIHDSGSFIIEYLLTDKPCMYLEGEKRFPLFNELSKAALQCYTKGISQNDIEAFIKNRVLRQNESDNDRRHRFIRDYITPPNGASAAQNIINAILG